MFNPRVAFKLSGESFLPVLSINDVCGYVAPCLVLRSSRLQIWEQACYKVRHTLAFTTNTTIFDWCKDIRHKTVAALHVYNNLVAIHDRTCSWAGGFEWTPLNAPPCVRACRLSFEVVVVKIFVLHSWNIKFPHSIILVNITQEQTVVWSRINWCGFRFFDHCFPGPMC